MAGLRRAVWGLADQGLSSLTNFALVIAVARSTPGRAFGGFSVVLAVYLVLGGISQGIASIPLSVRFSAGTQSYLRSAARNAVGTALWFGLISGAAFYVVSLVMPREIGQPLAALAVMLPGLLLQDSWRFVFLTEGRPKRAAINDAAWTLVQFAGFALMISTGRLSPANWVTVWGAAATIAAVIGCFQFGALPRMSGAWHWLKQQRRLAGRYALEAIVIRSSPQVALLCVGVTSGLSAVGSLKAAQVLFSPLNSLFLGGLFVAVPEGVRALASSLEALTQLVRQLTFATIGIAFLWGAMVVFAPDSLGRSLLGGNWATARPLLLAVGLQYVLIAASVGAQVGLRSLAAAGKGLYAQVAHAIFVLFGAALGAAYKGAYGAAAGIALGTGLGVLVFWQRFVVASHQSPGRTNEIADWETPGISPAGPAI